MRRAPDPGDRRPALRLVAGEVGALLLVPAVLAVTGAAVAVAAREWYAVPGFVLVALGAGAVGAASVRQVRPPRAGSLRQALVAVALGWLAVALVATVPFVLAAVLAASHAGGAGSGAVFIDPWSALFEAMSSFTSTGLTMVDFESELPHALQWWRSVLQWAGAAGVVVLVLALAGGEGEAGLRLYEAEGRSWLVRQDVPATARLLWRILLGLTALSVAAFLLAGADPWVAVNHGLTGISTGGMTVTDDSFRSSSLSVRVVGIGVMVLGAVSYSAFGLLLRGELRAVLRLTQLRALAVGLALGTGCVLGTLAKLGRGPGALDAAFLWVSALTTSGFATADVQVLPAATLVLLLTGMLVGGSAGSTTGGIKLRRAAWLGVAAVRAPGLVHPSGSVERPWRFDGREVDGSDAVRAVASAGALAATYLAVLTAGTVLLALSTGGRLPLGDVLFEAASALNTVGLSAGVAGPDLPWHAKALLATLMWAGRLEVVAVMVLVVAPLRRLLPGAR